jgi:hypothetical protein
MTAYPELEIGLHRFDAEAWTVDLRFSDPESDGFDSSATSTELVDFQQLRELLADDQAYGAVLGQALLADPAIRERFARARATAQSQRLPLRVRLFIGPSAPELHLLRWETLREPQEHDRLLTDDHLLFSRFLSSQEGVSVPFRPRAELRALVVIANPADLAQYGLAPLDVDAELQRVRAGLGDIACTELPGQGRPTLGDITAHLREGYDILFLVCHGAARAGEAQLWLEDDTGHTQRLPGKELVDRLRELSRRPRLVVLASCQSAGDGGELHGQDEGALATLGPRLARAGIPAVVAMQGNVSKRTVDAFMPKFFEELQRDGQIDRAMTVARAAVCDLNRSDWWMLVLFLALKSGRIWYEPGFEERGGAPEREMEKWPALLRSIREERCTPILGPGLIESLVGSRREIAMRWASDYRYPMAQYDRQNLPQVAQYLAVHLDPAFVRDELQEHLRDYMVQQHGDKLPEEIHKSLEELEIHKSLEALLLAEGRRRRERDPSEPHKVLAELPFKIYVTAGLSNLLGDALVDAGKKPDIELCRWNDDLELPPPIYDEEPDYLPSKERPFVYHVFGHLKDPDSLVLTEDDYFDFLIGVTKNNDMIPHFVRSALTHTALLFLGFRLDEWDFRVLFRSLMSQEGRNLRKKFSHVAVQIDPEEGQMSDPEGARRYLSSYFQDARITLYWGSAETFARELKERSERLPQ